MEKIKIGTNWMQHAFNFTLEKIICLKKHNNGIKVGLFSYTLRQRKWDFFAYKKDGGSINVQIFDHLLVFSYDFFIWCLKIYMQTD